MPCCHSPASANLVTPLFAKESDMRVHWIGDCSYRRHLSEKDSKEISKKSGESLDVSDSRPDLHETERAN